MNYLLIATILYFSNGLVQAKGVPFNCSLAPAEPSFQIDKCCKFPQLFDKKFLDDCSKKFNDDNGNDPCSAQCLFNKTGLVTGTTVNQAAVSKFVNDALSKVDAWKGLSDDLLKSSFAELKSYVKADQQGPDDCKADSAFWMSSFYFHMITKCPDSAFNKDIPQCPKIREYLNNCGSKN